MVILAHRLPIENGQVVSKVVQTVYAHLDEIMVRLGETVQRGAEIGSVGTADGKYLAHLHFEVREGPYPGPGGGYADVPMNRVSPTRFLYENRGAPDDLINAAPMRATAEVEVTRQPARLKDQKVREPEQGSPQ